MRLRYLAVNSFDVASKSSREEYLRNALPPPLVTYLAERFDTFSKLDANDSCHRDLLNSPSPKVSLKLPQDFPRVEETNTYDKFLSEIFPVHIYQPSIHVGAGVLSLFEILCWLRSEMGIELQSENEDVLTCIASRRIDISEVHDVTSKFYHKMKYAPCSEQSTTGSQGKEQQPKLTIFELPEIEPPMLELLNGIPWPQDDCSRIILELGGILQNDVENKEEAAAKIDVPKAWFDVSALPYSPNCYVNCSTAWESVFNVKQKPRRIDEAFLPYRCPDRITNQTVEILPVEIPMIPEKYNSQPVDRREVIYPLKPSCLLHELHENKIEKEAQTLLVGDLNTQTKFGDILTSKLFYHNEYLQPAKLPSGLLLDQSGPQPCRISVIDCACGPFQCTKHSVEIPRTCDWPLSSLANTSTGIIAAGEFQKVVPDLPVLYPSKTFESLVVIPELSLDDNQFQFLPVPEVTCPQDDMIELGKLVSLTCEASTVPATDWLYLDWHFYHGLKCTKATCFRLQSQLTEEAQCQPLTSTLATTEVLALRKCSELPLDLKMLQSHDFSVEDSYPSSYVTGTAGEKVEVLLSPPLADVSRNPVELSCLVAVETQKHQERECQRPSVGFPKDGDGIAANVFLPHHASKGLQSLCTPGKIGLQLTNCSGNPVSKQRLSSQNREVMEQLRIAEPVSTEIANGGSDLHCQSQEEKPSSDLVTRKDLRTISTWSYSDFKDSDLDFFVQARKGINVTATDRQTMKGSKDNSFNGVNELLNSANSQRALLATGKSDVQNHTKAAARVCEHEIGISKRIRESLLSLSRNYFTLLALEKILEMNMQANLIVLNQFDVDGDSHLASLISNVASQPPSHQRQVLLRGLVALQVLRRTALNLCNYGIQVAYLFLEHSFERMQFLEGYIMSSRIELEEAYNQVESGVVEDHPKLCYLDKLLRPVAMETNEVKYLDRRILLLADRRAFFTLVRKLVSLGLTPYQIDRKENYLYNGVLREDGVDKLKDEILEALTFSDCLLVSYAYVHSWFPVEKFTMIIQYADPPSVDAIKSSLRTARCEIQVLRLVVHIEDFKGNSSKSSRQNCQEPQACNLSGSGPLLEPDPAPSPSTKVSSGKSEMFNQDGPPIESEQPVMSSSECPNKQKVDSCSVDTRCEMIIVANISHINDQVLTGRRSSFQKILHLEKENLQVVERELRIPIDLIMSPASCLVVYTLGKLNLELQSLKDKQAFLNEVTTHLKAVSFSFSDCIMIFEGPTEFTTAALDIFPRIYELAIALEMQVLCFASRHPEVTDSIMIGSIQSVRTSKRSLSYPTMTEGSTLVEVFLTQFPSINPLTAHAILSSGCSLPEFMTYTPEQQLTAVEEYDVPKRCLDLFKAQCTYKAIATLQISDCKGLNLNANHHEEISHGYRKDALADCEDLPNQGSPAEVWTSFPEFPPASTISDSPTRFSATDTHTVGTFPDYPPTSEVRGSQDEIEEDEPSSKDLYSIPEGSFQHQHEIYLPEAIQRDGNSSGGKDLRSPIDFCGAARQKFRLPLHSSLSFEPRIFQWSQETSSPVNDIECFHGNPEKFHGGSEIPLDFKEISGPERLPRQHNRLEPKDDFRPVAVRRGASHFNFEYTPRHGKRLEKHNGTGSWNDRKRVRLTGDFNDNTIDFQDYGGRCTTNLLTDSTCLDDLSTAEPDWIVNTESVHGETTFYPESKQSRGPQSALTASSLNRFPHQNGSHAPGTASTSYTQAKIKLPRTAPPRSRTKSANVTYLRPAATWKPALGKKTLRGTVDKRSKMTLGFARRGSDTQSRLVWMYKASSSGLKR